MANREGLIEKFCTEMVEWKELGEILDYEQPTKYIVKSTKYDNNFKTPVLTAGQSFILGYTKEEENIFNASKGNEVIIFDDFTTSFHWVDFPFKVKSSAMKMLKIKDKEKISFKYVYYFMQTINYRPLEHKRHWIGTYSKIKIPVPSLKEQGKIVQILDNFSELAARKKQYEYYREKLLTFGEEVEWLELEEVCHLKGGYTPSTKNKEYWENGTIPWFRLDDIRTNGRILSESIRYITEKGATKIFPKNSIIFSTSATIGEHALITTDYTASNRFVTINVKDEYKERLYYKFLFYYCYIIKKWALKNVKVAKFPAIDLAKLRKLKIPIPPMSEQKRIVEILDKFDALCNDICKGLPAEIKARKKQYEYYRDKILNFK